MPFADGIGAGGHLHRLAEQGDLAVVGLVVAGEDRDEGRLARPVLADDPVDRAGLDGEVDTVVGADGAELLHDPAKA